MANGFAAGMEIGRRAINDGFERRRQEEIDKRTLWEFEQRKLEAERMAQTRAELADVAQGVTPGVMPAGVRLPEQDPGMPGDAGTIAPPAGVPLAPRYSPQQAQERIAGIALKTGDVKGYNSARGEAKKEKMTAEDEAFAKKIMSMPEPELLAEAKKLFTDNPKIPGKLEVDPKTGMMKVIMDNGTVTPPMSSAQARTFMFAAHKMGQGDLEKGLGLLVQEGERIRTQMVSEREAENRQTAGVGEFGLKVRGADRQDKHMTLLEKAEARKAAAAEKVAANATKERWSISPSITNEKGEVLLVNERDGSTKPMPGVKPVRDPRASGAVTKQDIAGMASDIIKSGEINPVTKKAYTAVEAREMAQEFYGVGEKTDELGDLARILKEMKDKKDKAGNTPGGPKGGLDLSQGVPWMSGRQFGTQVDREAPAAIRFGPGSK